MKAPQDRTHCPQGHEYTKENTVYKFHRNHRPTGKVGWKVRVCRECRRVQGREAARRRRAREKRDGN